MTSSIVKAIVSVRRLTEFLNARELQHDARKLSHKASLEPGDKVDYVQFVLKSVSYRVQVLVMGEANFAWSHNASSPTLEGITLTVRMGELVGVFGRVGAGKVIQFYRSSKALIY